MVDFGKVFFAVILGFFAIWNIFIKSRILKYTLCQAPRRRPIDIMVLVDQVAANLNLHVYIEDGP